MRLSGLLGEVRQSPAFRRTVARLLASADSPSLLSCIEPARPYALAALRDELRAPLLVVVARPPRARLLAAELQAWVDDPHAVLLFPETDALPYDYLPNDSGKLADRVAVLRALSGVASVSAPPIVVAPVRAVLDLLASPELFAGAHVTLRVGARMAPAALAQELVGLGYGPTPLVDQPGLFSRRGGILDFYPPGGVPTRVEFWGDDVDSMRQFDPSTQRSSDPLTEVCLGPSHEVLARTLDPSLDLEELRSPLRESMLMDLEALRAGQSCAQMDFYRGYLGDSTLLDYAFEGTRVVLEEPDLLESVAREFEEQVERMHADLLERRELPAGFPTPYRTWLDVMRSRPAGSLTALRFDPDQDPLPFAHAPRFAGHLDLLAEHLQGGGPRAIVVTQQAERTCELLAERGIAAHVLDAPTQDASFVPVLHGLLSEGWVSEEMGRQLITDGELFGWSKERRAAETRHVVERRAAARERFLADLAPGDLVVHADHGIARYAGLIRAPVGYQPDDALQPHRAPPAEAEFLLLEFAGTDRLYVPIAQADRVSRYVGGGDTQPSLTRFGSGEWTRAKARVRRAVRDIALELMELYGARQAVQGHAFSPDTPWQSELEGSFPFEETPDQIRAIHDVKRDMESPRPMDRLLVGDVGFGKTEVALRAAFKAVQDGCQVAVLVPTTVLAQQHFKTFSDRLGAFPMRVEMLSRFRSEKEQRAVLRGLADGSVDICIGTHRLVQADVRFNALGLAIIDEEQRFGVSHKERFKQLRHAVDVLTLTATPIPRTLHMGLAGLRDMSLLESAPEARLPVRTYLAANDDGIVREAILREVDRGGQVYFVNNRVQGIERIAASLQRMLPDLRVAVAHGQMPEDELERTMLLFAEGEFDVLVCTTIIESGLDIPNANTLIVSNAHRFGLAQLYQLRGRVGRSPQRAYAYLFHPQNAALSEVATQRLRAIFEATDLGAGLRIAMRDLEIRGAGSLLGAAQSGQIAAVGFDLYTSLLAEQVNLLKAREGAQDGHVLTTEPERPSIDLPIRGALPRDYVPDEPTRLRLYQRFSAIHSDQALDQLVEELKDRFGPLPPEAQDLVYVISVRLRAQDAGLVEIAAAGSEIILRFPTLPPLNRESLSAAAGTPVRFGSNQVRLPRAPADTWTGRLYSALENLGEQASRGWSRAPGLARLAS